MPKIKGLQQGLTNHSEIGMARGHGRPFHNRGAPLAMHKLRGPGSTFSTSDKDWRPFRFNPRLAAKKARLHRLKRKGLAPETDKHSLRQAADRAAATHPIKRVP